MDICFLCVGKGMVELLLVDWVIIVNMVFEYGVIMGFFLVDKIIFDYLMLMGCEGKKVCCY